MEKEISLIEIAIIHLAEKVESGEWQGITQEIKDILGYNLSPTNRE